MKIRDKAIVVTGAASGIGRALCLRFAQEGARMVIAADVDLPGTEETVAMLTALDTGSEARAIQCDVSREEQVRSLAADAEASAGQIDLFCANAGIFIPGDEQVGNDDWQRIWDINVMAHVYAARAVLPAMLARGEGYLLNTASAAGLLSQVGSAPYAVTKHAAVGFAEWLSITYGHQGIKVSVLCPQAVRTAMTAGGGGVAAVDGMLEPEQLADSVVETLDSERFLVLPHPEVLTYMRRKTDDYDRWLGGMRRLNDRFADAYRQRQLSGKDGSGQE